MSIGEKLFGEYVWGVYDLLVLPPSFPYGGMENPCLTFVTPTLLAGDKSLADVVAHEITHSWFGNLCTNRSWECFWLNEGFTKFGECRIMQNMNGKDYEQLLLRNLCIKLKEDVSHFGNGHEFTKLCVSAAIILLIGCVLARSGRTPPGDVECAVSYWGAFVSIVQFSKKLVVSSMCCTCSQ